MECPHCGSEALLGATRCMACGKSMFDRVPNRRASDPRPPEPPAKSERGADEPPPGKAVLPGEPLDAPPRPASPPDAGDGATPAPARRATDRVAVRGMQAEMAAVAARVVEVPAAAAAPTRGARLCSLCFGPCGSGTVCASCRDASGSAPAPAADAGLSYQERLASGRLRPPPVRRKSALARALPAIVWGVLLVGAGLAVVRVTRPVDPAASLLSDMRREPVEIGRDVRSDSLHRLHTEIDVRLVRAKATSSYDKTLTTLFDIHQTSAYDAEISLAGTAPGALLFDVASACRLVSQDGQWETRDGSHRALFPWTAVSGRHRLLAPEAARPVFADGGDPVRARDVPPLFTFGATAPPPGEIAPGTEWRSEVLLPCVADADGALAQHGFDGRFVLEGHRILGAYDCAVVRLEAKPHVDLGGRFGTLQRARGTVSGALAFDRRTGLLVRAVLAIGTTLESVPPTTAERVGMTGTLHVDLRDR